MVKDIQPRGEALRRAIRWLSDQQDHRPRAIYRAAEKFDLSPLDTEFLVNNFARAVPSKGDPENGPE